MSRYDDIISLPHPTSSSHPRMSMSDRAAQFSPFAALSGYEDAIRETARFTDSRVLLDEGEMMELDRKLREASENDTQVEITHFVPDERKAGGRYEKVAGRIVKVDTVQKVLYLDTGAKVVIDSILDVECP